MNKFNKKRLLEIMANVAPGRGVAEHESNDENIFLKNFLPLPSHRMALEVDTLLILGERGAGKTEFFRLLGSYSGRQALVKNLNVRGLPPLETTIWISGYGRTKTGERKFLAPYMTEKYMKYRDRIDWRIFWIGLILRVIFQEEKELSSHSWVEEIPESARNSLNNNLLFLSDWFPDVQENFESINYALDKLDEELLASDRWLFITYDELDRIVLSYLELAAPIAELLAFWLDRWRRWERIRPKIFLRTDLFRQEFLGFPDTSKFRGHQISLEWEISWLYQVFVKRLANSGSEMNDYLQIVPGLISKKDETLGILPALDESCFELLIEKIVGEWIGDNAQESSTYKWIPNHLQDAKRRIVPRSFLKLFSLAAERRLKKFEEKDLPENRLLEPSDLQVALMGTSKDRIEELTLEEYPWLEALKIGLKNLNLLTEEENFLKILENTKWHQEPPSRKPQEVLKYLEELGIVEIRRSDRRINMPDIYRYGFEVQRKGGIKRRMEVSNVLTINKYASALMELDRVEEALPLFEKALQLEPDNFITIYGYTTALIKLGRVEETLPLFQKVLLELDNLQTIRRYTNALMKLGRVEDTLPLFEKALQLEPDSIKTILNYANALMKLGRVEDTLPLFEKALQLQPDNVQTIYGYANVLMKLGRVEDTLPLLEKSLQLEPNNVLTIYGYANVLMKLERLEEALPLFEKSLQLEPNNIKTISSYVNALMKLERVEDTLPLFEKALLLEPNNVLTISSYVNALMKLERVEDTLPLFEKALQLEPNNVLTIYGYVSALMELGRVEEALPLLKKSLQLEPDDFITINIYAHALIKLGRVEETLPLFKKALQLEPDDFITIRSYADALMKLERVEETLPLFKKALQLEPDDFITIRSYALALMTLERVEESLPWFEKALQLKPDNVLTINSYAVALIELQRVEETLPLFEKALQLNPNKVLTINNYATALMKLKRVEDSLPWFEKALQLEPDNVITLGSYPIALMEVGKFEEFCQFFEKLLELKDDNYVRYEYATALEELGQYQQAIKQLEKINLTDLLPYYANVIRLTLGKLYYSIEEPKKGNQYFQEAIDNSDERDKTLLHSARNILANNPYDKKALEMLDKIAQDSPPYVDALKMLTFNLDSEGYYEEMKPETKLKDTQILNRAIYHKIGNEIAILKSIAYRILRDEKDKNSILNDIIEKIEKLVEQIAERREIQKDETNKIPEDDYQQVLSVISKTAHDISDFVNNELAVIKSKILRVMRKVDSEPKIYSQYEKLLTQLELTQAALNDLKGINEGINIKKKHFPVKKIFEKWKDNNQIENAEIKLEITNGDSEFYGDEEKIKSALNEMVENSLKHNSDQQKLIIKMKSQDVINPESIRGFTMSGEKKYLLIEFSDNGKGISEDKKQWIFQPLTTTSKKGQGSGLGLYIIRKTLVKMEGHIQETGENGVRFQMYIPYSDR